ncbi:MAG: hypothetical protein CFE21_08955 [Bacteroidetes bacterium B1(2017)]|nr:MAG: hypothetical protein CFE21_08955 [Bacteroidetes bacterium B1(2017)]
MNHTKFRLSIHLLVISTFLILLNSCTTIVQTGYEHHLTNMGIDLSKNNLEYQIPQENKKPLISNKQLDTFDQVFFTTLETNIKYKGYQLNQRGIVQTYTLKNCLIDIQKSEPLPFPYHFDTLTLHKITSSLICQEITDTTRLFFTTYETWQEYEVIPIKIAYRSGIDSIGYTETTHFWYKEVPINNEFSKEMAEELALKSFDKIDSLNQVFFTKTKPELASEIHRTNTTPDPVVKGLFKILILTAIILFISLGTTPQ